MARIIGGIIVAVVALIACALFAVWLLVNPNNTKTKIAAAVKEATGRDLKLSGDIKLSVFPWVALELGPASLGNPPGFGDAAFLSFTHAAVRVRLLPLLRERLEIARIELDGLDLRLLKNAQGRGNWQSPSDAVQPATIATRASFGHGQRELQSLADVRIQRGRVSYQDLVIENVDLETGSMAGQHDVPIRIGFDAKRVSAQNQATVTANFDLSIDAASGVLRFAAVNLSGTWSRPGDGRPAHWELSLPVLDVNLDAQTAAAPAFNLSYSSLHVAGSVTVAKLADALSATGSLTLMPVVLHEIAPRLGVVLPRTRDAEALSGLSGSTDFAYDAAGFSLEKLLLRLDDTQLRGSIHMATGQTTALKFELAADQIDLDRYRPPDGSVSATAASGTDVTPASTQPIEESPPSETSMPAQKLTPFSAEGSIALAAAHAAGMDFTQLNVSVAVKDGVTHLDPIEAQIDGGQFAGELTWDQRGPIPALNFDEQLTGVDMRQLLANTAQQGRISGRANVALKATARGAGADAILKTLNGHLDANLADGAVEGVDVGYAVGQAQVLFDRKGATPPADTKRTKFDVFKTTAQITNGVAVTHDLTISSAAFKVAGEGSANLPTQAIDFKLTASILQAPSTTMVDIPLKITGTFADLKVRADVQAVAKDEIKQKLQDVLKKNGLQGLFK